MALLRRLVSLAAVCLCAAPLTGARDIVGAVNLDSYTLDKVGLGLGRTGRAHG